MNLFLIPIELILSKSSQNLIFLLSAKLFSKVLFPIALHMRKTVGCLLTCRLRNFRLFLELSRIPINGAFHNVEITDSPVYFLLF